MVIPVSTTSPINVSLGDQIDSEVSVIEDILDTKVKQDTKNKAEDALQLLSEYAIRMMMKDVNGAQQVAKEIGQVINSISTEVQSASDLESLLKSLESDPSEQTLDLLKQIEQKLLASMKD